MTNDLDNELLASTGTNRGARAAFANVETLFPDVIEIANDTPAMIGEILGADGGDTGLQIVRIEGRDIDPVTPTPLPGIRVGGEAGGGFIFRRELDKQLVFAPDSEYSGITSFTYTIADSFGEAATVRATVSVLPAIFGTPDLTFADGTQWASVPEGIDAAILGALTIGGDSWDYGGVVQVFENGSDTPSTRFEVTGDKLKVVEPLDGAAGHSIDLRIVVRDGDGNEVISSGFEVNVRGHGGSAAIEDHPSPLQVDASRAQAPGWSEFFEHPAFDYFDFCGTEASLAYDQSEQDALAHSEHAPDQTRVPASVVFEEMTQPEPGSAPSDIISF